MNYSDMNVTQLKAEAKTQGIRGFSKMNKAELVSALTPEVPATPAESFVDGLVASYRANLEGRRNKGRKAGSEAAVTLKMHPATKALNYRLSRGSQTAKLTGKQSRRVRKAEAKLHNQNRERICRCIASCPTDHPNFTFTYQ